MANTGTRAIVVLTALSVECYAVLQHLENRERVDHPTGLICERGELPDTPWQIYVAEAGEGSQAAATLTERAISWLSPRAVFFTGIAGGLKRDLTLGDVVVATQVWGYQGGRQEDSGLKARPKTWETAFELQQVARYVGRRTDWTKQISPLPDPLPRMHLKPILAGEIVLDSAQSDLVEYLDQHYNGAAAIETEGAGFASAAHLAGGVPFLVVRGISDRADGTKSGSDEEGGQKTAARHAAAATMAIIAGLSSPADAPGRSEVPVKELGGSRATNCTDREWPTRLNGATGSSTTDRSPAAGEGESRAVGGQGAVPERLSASIDASGDWVLDRPVEMRALVAALTARQERGFGAPVVGLHGAGGFGKTVLCEGVCEHPDVQSYFGGRIFRISLGRDAKSPASVADKINNLITDMKAVNPGYTDPTIAAIELNRLIAAHPRSLLAVDDVWYEQQLTPFLASGSPCTRLICTRIPALLPASASRVEVDRMTAAQSEAVLLHAVDPKAVPIATLRELVRITGRWPLLLKLASGFMAAQHLTGPTYGEAAEALLTSIRAAGPAATVVSGSDYEPAVDLGDSSRRRRIVRATIEAGTKLLPSQGEELFNQLGIFTGNEPVPMAAVIALWSESNGLDETSIRSLCLHLARLSLISLSRRDGGSLSVHDVVRDYLRQELGQDGISAANRCFIDGARRLVTVAADTEGTPTPWWEVRLPYVRDHLIRHLIEAGCVSEARETSTDLRWIESRLRTAPNAPHADLVQLPGRDTGIDTAIRALGASTHLLTPTEPTHSLTDILYSRLAHVPLWRDQIAHAVSARTRPRLVNEHSLPDTPHPAVERTLTTSIITARSPQWSPDSRQLAAICHDAVVRVWDPDTGSVIHTLEPGQTLRRLAWSPDSCFLATLSGIDPLDRDPAGGGFTDGGLLTGSTLDVWDMRTGTALTLVRDAMDLAWSPDSTHLLVRDIRTDGSVWDAAKARRVHTLHSPGGPIAHLAWSPDGAWIAGTGMGLVVYLWDVATLGTGEGHPPALLQGHTDMPRSFAWSPDSSRLATTDCSDGVHLWDIATRTVERVLTGHEDSVRSKARSPVSRALWSPDGSRIVSVDRRNTTRVWNVRDGVLTHLLHGDNIVAGTVCWSADGTAITAATTSGDVRVWDAGTGEVTHAFPGQGHSASPHWAPDNSMLLIQAESGIRVWGPDRTQPPRTLSDQVTEAKWSPDSTRLATGDHLGHVRIWRPRTSPRTTASERKVPVHTLTWSPGGRFLATTDVRSRTGVAVRLWDASTAGVIRRLNSPIEGVRRTLWSPDGALLAASDGVGTVQLWRTDSGERLRPLHGHTGAVNGMAWSPDGTRLATVDGARILRVWDHAAETVVSTGNATGTPAWSSDSSCLIAPDSEGRLLLRDSRTGATLHVHTCRVRGLTRAPDGDRIATLGGVGSHHAVRIWASMGRVLVRELPLPGCAGLSLTWSPDGTLLAVLGVDGSIQVWETATGTLAYRLEGTTRVLAWSPDSKYVVAVERGTGGVLTVWDPRAGHRVAVMRTEGELSLCGWSTAGPLLAAAGEGGLYFFCYDEGNGRP